jgi:hypothetical protein
VKASKTDKGRILFQGLEVTGYSGPLPAPAGGCGHDELGGGQAGRGTATQAAGAEELPRLNQGPAAGVGRLKPAVREVPSRVDANPAGRAAARRSTSIWPRPEPPVGSTAATTTPAPLLSSSITIRKNGDEVEVEPEFFEGGTVAQYGPRLKGEFALTMDLHCVHIGSVFARIVRNNAHALTALYAAVKEIPFQITSLDYENGSQILNKVVIGLAADRESFFTRTRPYKKHHQATVESKNNRLGRNYGSTTATTTSRSAGR